MTYQPKPVTPLRTTDPRRIGPYRIVGRLGCGGEARVFLGTSELTGSVAVKVLGPRTDERDPTCATEFAFVNEVNADSAVPGIAYGMTEFGPYLVTEYQPDAVAANSLPAGHMDDAELWRIGAGAAHAIDAVHAAGLIHCDVKPANVMVSPTSVRLLDFGIAREIDDQPADAPRVYCSRGWAAPEQLYAGPLTPSVDVFGWGCVIAFLASGEAPFAADTEEEWIVRVRLSEPDLSGLPLGLDTLVQASLSRDPRRRPSALDLAQVCAYEVAHGGRTGGVRRARPQPRTIDRTSAPTSGRAVPSPGAGALTRPPTASHLPHQRRTRSANTSQACRSWSWSHDTPSNA